MVAAMEGKMPGYRPVTPRNNVEEMAMDTVLQELP
jgi:hypothetical protein